MITLAPNCDDQVTRNAMNLPQNDVTTISTKCNTYSGVTTQTEFQLYSCYVTHKCEQFTAVRNVTRPLCESEVRVDLEPDNDHEQVGKII